MFSTLLMLVEKNWKPATWMMIVALGLLWVGVRSDDLTVAYLDQFFVSDVQAQEMEKKVEEIDRKVETLSTNFTSSRRADIEREIFTQRVAACMNPFGPLRTMYEDQIRKLVSEWRAITKQPGGNPPMVSCSELGVE